MTSKEHPTATITTPNSTPGQSGRFGSERVAAFIGMRSPYKEYSYGQACNRYKRVQPRGL